MKFKSDIQRKAMFANINRFSTKSPGDKLADMVIGLYPGGIVTYAPVSGNADVSNMSSKEFEEIMKQAEAGPGSKAWDIFQSIMEEKSKAVREAEKNMTAQDFIEKQKGFVSTKEIPSPLLSGTGLDELAAVVAGTKSAAIISDPRSVHDSRFNELLDKAKESGLTIVKYPESDYGEGRKASVYLVGIEPNASVIRSYLGEGGSEFVIPRINKEDEIIVSRALGYAPEATEDYIKKRYQ